MSSSISPSRSVSPVPRRSRPRNTRKKDPQTPQQKIDEFWDKYKSKAPGRASTIIPQNEFAERAARRASAKSKAPAKTTEQSYEAAAEQCRRKVAQIVKECRRVNQKYRDPHFDLELDQVLNRRDCLDSLDNVRDNYRVYSRHPKSRGRELPLEDRDESATAAQAGPSSRAAKAAAAAGPGSAGVLSFLNALEHETAQPDGDTNHTFRPKAVKRVVDIFDNPQFFIDGPTANDVRQGRDGDCWLMAALCTLSNKPGLIERCCVAHDQDVGVYGFVFHRDGEWFSEIIDDKLYLTKPDYDESHYERILWEDRERVNSEEAYRKAYQSNSGALYFAQCVNPNETWLPLLEKAYAKAHGDYSAIEGGFGGEGIEDLTGGVTSEVYTSDILDREYFWNEELMKVNQDFLFGCSTGVWGLGWGERRGIVELHAYSVLKACEIDGVRLVLLKNPWGKHEWKGPWSDGSKEWTAEWLQKLDHKFGDDGSFWISYSDLLKKYQAFDRTRLFSPGEWKVASIWTTLDVPWTIDYHDTKFAFSLARSGPVVIVFSQLDERYFRGLQGQYRFELGFRVHKAGGEDYVVRSQNAYRMNRSVNVELELEAGEYVVVVKIDAQRREHIMPVEEVVRAYAKDRREKLRRIGRAYDVAHSKGKIAETPGEKAAREAFEQRKRDRERKQWARLLLEEKKNKKKAILREKAKEKKARDRREAKAQARAERRAARRQARLQADAEERAEKEKAAADRTATGAGQGSRSQTCPGEAVHHQSEDARGCTESSAGKTGEQAESGGTEPKAHAVNGGDKDHHQSTDAPADKQEDTPEGVQGASAAARRGDGPDKPQAGDAATQTPTEEEQAENEIPPGAECQEQGSDGSTEGGEDTPGSSDTVSVDIPIEGGAEPPEEEDYVTAAETDSEDKTPPSAPRGDAATPRPARPAACIPENKSVGVQTGPGLPFPPPLPPPRPMHRGPPPPGHPHGMYASGAPPPPAAHYGPPHGPPPGFSHPPAHVHRGYGAEGPAAGPYTAQGYAGSSGGSSESELESDVDDVSEVSEHDIDMCVASARAAASKAATGKAPAEQPTSSTDEEPMDEYEKDPWNAVGVFGLRVYYRVAEGAAGGGQEGVGLRVERPNPYVWDESSDDEADDERDDEGKGGDGKEEQKVLDVDDSAKDAVGEQTPAPGEEGAAVKEEEKAGGEKESRGNKAQGSEGEVNTKIGEQEQEEEEGEEEAEKKKKKPTSAERDAQEQPDGAGTEEEKVEGEKENKKGQV